MFCSVLLSLSDPQGPGKQGLRVKCWEHRGGVEWKVRRRHWGSFLRLTSWVLSSNRGLCNAQLE